jgi:hypothetical protein
MAGFFSAKMEILPAVLLFQAECLLSYPMRKESSQIPLSQKGSPGQRNEKTAPGGSCS